MDLVSPEVSRPAFRSRAVPLGKKRLLRAPRFAPTDAVSHRGVRRRHRLTIESNHAVATARVIRAFGSAKATRSVRMPHIRQYDTPLPIHEGHAVLGPRQVVPRPLRVISHAPGPSPTAGTFIAAGAASLNPDTNSRSRAVCFPLDRLDPKTRKTQNPSTLPLRSHVSSLLCATQRGHHRVFRWPVGSRSLAAALEAIRPPTTGGRSDLRDCTTLRRLVSRTWRELECQSS